jgi:hypothetical protein
LGIWLGGLAVIVLVVILLSFFEETSGPDATATTTGGPTSTGLPVQAAVTTTASIASPTTTSIASPTTTASLITTTTIAPTRYEQNDSNLLYAGTWSPSASDEASGRRFRYTDSAGSLTVSFTGTYLAWIAKMSPVYGMAAVTLDDQAPVTVDLYSADTLWQQTVWDTGILPPGTHTLTIEWTGTKSAAATATNINVDAFDVAGELLQAR